MTGLVSEPGNVGSKPVPPGLFKGGGRVGILVWESGGAGLAEGLLSAPASGPVALTDGFESVGAAPGRGKAANIGLVSEGDSGPVAGFGMVGMLI